MEKVDDLTKENLVENVKSKIEENVED